MAFIITKIDLQAYRDRIERQQSVLRFATVFSESEKEDVQKCYDELIAICDDRMAQEKATQNPAQ